MMVRFRVSTDILRRLGEELITSLDQGLVELVKNAHDADACECTVELRNVEKPGGTVVITDDGDGMSRDDMLDGWLVLGRSRKVAHERTPLGRWPAGSKGLGRLGALRMGDEVRLATRPRGQSSCEHSLCIRWPDFENRDDIDDVELSIHSTRTQAPPGTRIEIRGLKTPVDEAATRKLARELILLSDPFGDPCGFKPILVAPEFKALEELVDRAYFDDAELQLVADLDAKGQASAKVLDRSGNVRWRSSVEGFKNAYRAPAARFEVWVFLIQQSSFEGRAATVGEVRKWLKEVGGIHLYHRGLRVRPYGDPGHDWLDMNLARSRDPVLRPSTNTAIGRLTVLDEDEALLPKTDRTGFIENEAFSELRRFAKSALDWMHDQRQKERTERRLRQKEQATELAKRAEQELQKTLSTLPEAHRSSVRSAVRNRDSALMSERDQLLAELTLYQTMASVGTAVSVFAHEIEGPATDLTLSIEAVERRSRKVLEDQYQATIGRQIEAVKRSAERIARFATLPLALLKRSKRHRGPLDVNRSVEAAVNLFLPYLQDAHITVLCELCSETVNIRGSVSAVEAIVSNLITNAVKAFRRPGLPSFKRRLVVRTAVTGDQVRITVLDNGPGIPPDLGNRIWLPGVTSDENGTGLGLTIVRDTVSELRGTAEVVPKGELGGAEFIISLPRKEN